MTTTLASVDFPPYPPARIEVRGVTLARGELTLAKDIALTLGPGDAVLLRGPNGSGKTTLLRALAGFTPIEAGEIALTLDGREAEPAEMVAYLGHTDGLRRTETPRDHLTFIAQWLGAGTSRIDLAIRHFGLAPIANAPARRLSAGQRRRAALARLAAAPRPIWLLDEPAAPLDANGRAALGALVAAHRAAGGAVLAAVHDEPDWPDAGAIRIEDFRP
jgi:heme exporter protein A